MQSNKDWAIGGGRLCPLRPFTLAQQEFALEPIQIHFVTKYFPTQMRLQQQVGVVAALR
jgi:hypothetical protein